MTSKTLRDYQDEHFPIVYTELCNRRSVLLSYCVGSGKTLFAMTIASAALQDEQFSHVIILTPSTAIDAQFRRFVKNTKQINTSSRIVSVAHIEKNDKHNGQKYLIAYLNGDNDKKEIFVANYSIFKDDALHSTISEKIGKVLVVIDEAHHAATEKCNVISAETIKFRQSGGAIFGLSGTPYRTDQSQIFYDTDLKIKRSLIEHMLEGFAPSKIHSQAITIPGGATGDFSDDDDDTIATPLNEEVGFRMIVDQIIADGRPKCIVRIKPGAADKNKNRVKMLIDLLTAQHLSFVDATGDNGTPEFKALCELEDSGRILQYQELPDVVIAFGRMNEGVNLPSRSHVYFWGIPRSMQLFEQVLGRIMRKREPGMIQGYPESWLDASKITLFFGAVENASDKHTKFLMQLLSYLSDFEQSLPFANVTRINDNIPNRKGKTAKFFADLFKWDDDESNAVDASLKQAMNIFAQYKTQWTANLTSNGLIAMAKLIAEKQNLNVHEEEFKHKLMLKAGVKNPVIRAAIQEAVSKIDMSDSYPEDLKTALDSVYEEFQNECMLSENVFLINGESAAWIAELLNSKWSTEPKPTTLDEVMAGVTAFRKLNKGKFPKLKDIDPLRNRSFMSYDRSIKRGEFNGGDNLYDLIVAKMSNGHSWSDRLTPVVADMTRTVGYRSAEEAMNSSKLSIVLKEFAVQLPEMFYYSKAWEALRNFDWISEFTLAEANYVGGKSNLYIEKLMKEEGFESIRLRIKNRNL